jgi:hypothetical protein
MKQGTSNPTTSPPQRQITNYAMDECAVAKIGQAQAPKYGFMPPEPLVKGVISQPGGPGVGNLGNNGTQKG